MGMRHAQIYSSLPNVKLVAFCDVNISLADQAGKRFKVANFTDDPLRIMLDTEIQAVSVCVPTGFHHKLVNGLLKSGKFVLCEKPLTADILEAQSLARLSSESLKRLTIGYLYRSHPVAKYMKAILLSDVIGSPRMATFRIGGKGGQRPWTHMVNMDGGALLELGVHMIDLTWFFFGHIVNADLLESGIIIPKRKIAGNTIDVTAADYSLVSIDCENGVRVIVESDQLTPSYSNVMEIQGDNGSILAGIQEHMPVSVYLTEARSPFSKGFNLKKFEPTQMLSEEIGSFVNYVGGSSVTNPCPIDSSSDVANVITKVRRSELAVGLRSGQN